MTVAGVRLTTKMALALNRNKAVKLGTPMLNGNSVTLSLPAALAGPPLVPYLSFAAKGVSLTVGGAFGLTGDFEFTKSGGTVVVQFAHVNVTLLAGVVSLTEVNGSFTATPTDRKSVV